MAKKGYKNKKFWAVNTQNMDSGKKVGHLYLYGVIAPETWWGDEVTPVQFRDDITALGEIEELRVHIFSPGGDVTAGNAIYSILKQQNISVVAYVEGISASIATVVMMAADKVYLSRNANILVHNPMLGLQGYYNALQLETFIKELHKYDESILMAYVNKTGMNREEVVRMVDGKNMEGTLFTAQEAINIGLADGFIPEEVDSALPAVACIGKDIYEWQGHKIDLSPYTNLSEITNRRTKDMGRKKQGSVPVAKQIRKVINESHTVTCPECGFVFEWEDDSTMVPETEEVTNALVNITCPECGHTFEFDTSTLEEGDTGGSGGVEPIQEEGATARVTGKRVIAELLQVYCPQCYHEFTVETEGEVSAPEAFHKRKVKAEIFTVTCPECGHTFDCDSNPTVPAEPMQTVELTEEASASYSDGVRAERERLNSLDKIAEADPRNSTIVNKAKKEGWTYEKTCQRVFDAMSARTPSDEYMENRKGEIQNSNAAKIGSAAIRNGGRNAKEQDAINMILAGVSKSKNGGRK